MTLNIWGGHIHDPLLRFIAAHREVDIFCFQEVYHDALEKTSDEDRYVCLDIFADLQAALPDHQGYFRPVVAGVYGIAMFISKKIDVVTEGEISIYENPQYSGRGPAHNRIMQWAQCVLGGKSFSILNVHGIWNGRGKTDTAERMEQSKRIKDFMRTLDTPVVLCGDFNLRPDSESVKIIRTGMVDLIDKHNIQSTRTSFYPKEEKFADYIFTSPDITVNSFEVLKDEVSDHSPILVEFF